MLLKLAKSILRIKTLKVFIKDLYLLARFLIPLIK